MIPFLQARHYRPGPRSKIDLVVIHTAEIGQTLTSAHVLCEACAVTPDVKSWHYAVDVGEITQSVHETDIAFHAPGANSNGIGIELCARASQSAADWASPYNASMLALSAALVTDICARWGIPRMFVDAAALAAGGARGITTHAAVTAAFRKGTHTDPGPNFPMAGFIEQVRALGNLTS